MNSNSRIAATLYSVGTQFVSEYNINTLHKGDDDYDDDDYDDNDYDDNDDDDNNNNNNNKAPSEHLAFIKNKELFKYLTD